MTPSPTKATFLPPALLSFMPCLSYWPCSDLHHSRAQLAAEEFFLNAGEGVVGGATLMWVKISELFEAPVIFYGWSA
jgi:hypothetical protein